MIDLQDVEWIVAEPVYVRVVEGPEGENRYLVRDAHNLRSMLVGFDEAGSRGQILFNGTYVDVGDEFTAYLGLLDEAAEGKGEEIFSEPYDDAPEPRLGPVTLDAAMVALAHAWDPPASDRNEA